ncbi:MAG TPA: hypothetical protein VMS86_14270, partial [Thermoanaerobaculia bacterium]|nr:hypothetical protein [Thermoanaerobaculia bacterium]
PDLPAPAAPSRPSAPAAPAPGTAPSDLPRRVPSIQARPVLFSGGACPECKPGEWALIVERRAAPATGASDSSACGAGRETVAKRLANELLAGGGATVAAFAGPVADAWGNALPPAVWESIAPDLAGALRPLDGACQDLVAVLPQGARFIGFRFEAEDGGGKGDCFGEEPCAIGSARWTTSPRIERTATVTVIHSSFLNESPSAERRARMTLYFQPPRGWRAPG